MTTAELLLEDAQWHYSRGMHGQGDTEIDLSWECLLEWAMLSNP